jgi:cytidylate kinase
MGQRYRVIAVDGPGGVGKSTVARSLAARLAFDYVDTGAMYRAVAVALGDAGVDMDDEGALNRFLKAARMGYDTGTGEVAVNGVDYTGRIRTMDASMAASAASARRQVRVFLVAFQRTLAERGPVVMEGRDIGTVVFPDAEVKFFLDAPHEIRVKRRHGELRGAATAREDVSSGLLERDRRDAGREVSPLRMADDAIYVDTGGLNAEEVVKRLLETVEARGIRRAAP